MQNIDKKRFTHVGESIHDREAISSYRLTFMQDAMRRLAKEQGRDYLRHRDFGALAVKHFRADVQPL